jgi:abortive infection bacteriophage resistance protein
MDLKKPLTFDEQLDKLVAHGIVISDKENAKDILKKVNYYRFTGYALQFRQDPSDSDYKEGTTFDTVYHLYEVDEMLRDTFRQYIEKAEVYYRTQIAYGFSIEKCPCGLL